MSTLFDKLQEYIDKKIGSVPDEMQELFDEYGVKEVYEALPIINSVANHLVEIGVVNAYINDIITCSANIQYIIAAPQAAQIAIQKADESAQSATEAETHNNNAFLWSSAGEDIPVDDGVHTGYSAYHWAQKALENGDPELFYWRDGSRPLTNNFNGNNYRLTMIGDSVDPTDATSRRESVLINGNNTMTGSLVVDSTNKDITTRVFGNGFTSEQWKDKFLITDTNNITYSLVADEITGQLRLKVNNISSMSIFEGQAPSTQFAPVNENELTRKDYVDNGLSDKFNKSEHIDISTGTPDAAKPIILDGNGQIDASMIPMDSGWTNQGQFTPTGAQEYPDTTGLPSGSFWSVIGVDDVNGYTFTTGDLNGQIAYNADLMIWSGGSWSITTPSLNPNEFYKLDGSQAITGNFAGGGFKLTNIAPATQTGEAVEYSQIATFSTDFMRLDGTTPMQSALDMNGSNITNVANGINDADAVNMTQYNLKADIGYVDSENASQDNVIATKIGNVETGTTPVATIVSCTQTEYDTLTPVDDTLYIIVGA